MAQTLASLTMSVIVDLNPTLSGVEWWYPRAWPTAFEAHAFSVLFGNLF